ncbi:hypothetical protein GE061_010933 [Apolygus lucorum]|uniref:Uncharacterized protein n=1 Tax=Apolygus lucorum TaxID=248454 RepID=A0A8S9XYP1_APOLU|nr:hypothetical protein GE061_010933 [Apolygus lucorum]
MFREFCKNNSHSREDVLRLARGSSFCTRRGMIQEEVVRDEWEFILGKVPGEKRTPHRGPLTEDCNWKKDGAVLTKLASTIVIGSQVVIFDHRSIERLENRQALIGSALQTTKAHFLTTWR